MLVRGMETLIKSAAYLAPEIKISLIILAYFLGEKIVMFGKNCLRDIECKFSEISSRNFDKQRDMQENLRG